MLEICSIGRIGPAWTIRLPRPERLWEEETDASSVQNTAVVGKISQLTLWGPEV